MRICLLIILLVASGFARKSFTPDYFVNKHKLILPPVTKAMLDVSKYTHKSDTWEYFYVGKSNRIDSVYKYLNLEGFPPNKAVEKYAYRNDSIIVDQVSISTTDGDTTNWGITTFLNNRLTENRFDLRTKCNNYCKYATFGGKRLMEKKQCPGDPEPSGQEFVLTEKGEYIQSLQYYLGKVDSSRIRHYYFTAFDSLVADYIVRTPNNPIIVELNFYNAKNKPDIKYGFGINGENFIVTEFQKFTYNKNNQVARVYGFSAINRGKMEDGYALDAYTEYEYDALGRLTKSTTRVIPDPAYQKK